MQTRRMMAVAALGALLWSGIAAAKSVGSDNKLFGIYIKGGVGRYTSEYAPYTAYGPTYGAGIVIQPLSFLGIEIGYDGSHHMTQGSLFSLLPEQPGVLRNGASALLKLTAPLGWFRPFVGVGFGLSWVQATGNGSGFIADRFMQDVPLAGGLEFAAGPVVFGARFTYRFIFNGDFIQDPCDTDVRGGLGDLQGTVAFRF
jgi:hypothetical protein